MVYYKNIKLTNIQVVKLEKTDTMFKAIGFIIKVNINDKEKTITTKHVFSIGMIGANLIDDYSGNNASIGYNKKKDEWIIINKE